MNFKKKFKESLLKGKKRSTLRMGIKDYKVGEIVKVVAGDEEIGLAKIKEVKFVQWRDIGKKDVLIEGMKRKKDLKRELKSIYGEFDDESIFTQIVFKMLKNGKRWD